MQAGGGSGNGSGMFCIDGLISFPIDFLGSTTDIWRQWHLSQLRQIICHTVHGVELAHPLARIQGLLELAAQLSASKYQAGSDPSPASWSDQKLPPTLAEVADQENFHFATASLPNAKEPGWQNLRLVHHQTVAGIQVVEKILETPVLQKGSIPMNDQQTRLAPRGSWILRNEILGKLIIEI
jgi:hypothetical protein